MSYHGVPLEHKHFMDFLCKGNVALECKAISSWISACFRKAEANGNVKPINSTRVLQILQNDYTTLKITQGAKVNLGRAMKELDVETCGRGNVALYRVVPTKAV